MNSGGYSAYHEVFMGWAVFGWPPNSTKQILHDITKPFSLFFFYIFWVIYICIYIYIYVCVCVCVCIMITTLSFTIPFLKKLKPITNSHIKCQNYYIMKRTSHDFICLFLIDWTIIININGIVYNLCNNIDHTLFQVCEASVMSYWVLCLL